MIRNGSQGRLQRRAARCRNEVAEHPISTDKLRPAQQRPFFPDRGFTARIHRDSVFSFRCSAGSFMQRYADQFSSSGLRSDGTRLTGISPAAHVDTKTNADRPGPSLTLPVRWGVSAIGSNFAVVCRTERNINRTGNRWILHSPTDWHGLLAGASDLYW